MRISPLVIGGLATAGFTAGAGKRVWQDNGRNIQEYATGDSDYLGKVFRAQARTTFFNSFQNDRLTYPNYLYGRTIGSNSMNADGSLVFGAYNLRRGAY